MISKKTMWTVITVTMTTLAVAILITAVGVAFSLVGNFISSNGFDTWLDTPAGTESAEGEEITPSFFDRIALTFKNMFIPDAEPEDTKAPVITADKDTVIIYTGENVSLRSFVKVKDDSGEDCELKIDSNVDQDKPNDEKTPYYTVKFTATDPSGNKSKTFTLKVIVKDGTYSLSKLMTLVEQRAADKLGYTKSSVGSRTKVQIVKDIYNYVNDPTKGKNDANIYFSDISNTPAQKAQGGQKTRTGWQDDWVEEAYRTLSMTSMQGDCYSYYAVSKAFFKYFGIENEGIERSQRSTESGTHYWNIVKVEGGWYYYDATRLGGTFADGTRNGCLRTDAELRDYRTSKGGTDFYTLDKWQGFPTISTTPIK